MASADFVRSAASWASRNGGSAALLAIHDQIFSDLSTDGFKQLVNSTLNGKSFSFAIPSDMGATEAMAAMLEAVEIIDGTGRRATRTRISFA